MLDIIGSYLKEKFKNGDLFCLKDPEGMEKLTLWPLLKNWKKMFGQTQVAKQFWRHPLVIMNNMGHTCGIAGLWMYYSRNKSGKDKIIMKSHSKGTEFE